MTVLKSATPILFVRDVTASAAFFRDTLGFKIDFLHGEPPFYGSVSRGDACLHLRFVHEPVFDAEAIAHEESLIVATIEVDDINTIFEEFRNRGATFAQDIVKQEWGGTDFQIRDPDGNAISFVSFA
ncbi:MAG TPA: glyoxalase superfamily protein [Rhizomicrobium sp.]|nr:glyoxalase superfamily protein [Rhizomicrobium sp.]